MRNYYFVIYLSQHLHLAFSSLHLSNDEGSELECGQQMAEHCQLSEFYEVSQTCGNLSDEILNVVVENFWRSHASSSSICCSVGGYGRVSGLLGIQWL